MRLYNSHCVFFFENMPSSTPHLLDHQKTVFTKQKTQLNYVTNHVGILIIDAWTRMGLKNNVFKHYLIYRRIFFRILHFERLARPQHVWLMSTAGQLEGASCKNVTLAKAFVTVCLFFLVPAIIFNFFFQFVHIEPRLRLQGAAQSGHAGAPG